MSFVVTRTDAGEQCESDLSRHSRNKIDINKNVVAGKVGVKFSSRGNCLIHKQSLLWSKRVDNKGLRYEHLCGGDCVVMRRCLTVTAMTQFHRENFKNPLTSCNYQYLI